MRVLPLALPLALLLAACTGGKPDDTGPAAGDTDTDTDTDPPDGDCAEVLAYADGDGDGHGAGPERTFCEDDAGWAAASDDCDDADATVHPGAAETCNRVDDDCDGEVDEDPTDATAWYADADGDGYGVGDPVEACRPPADHAPEPGDCDDTLATRNPGATEVCGDGVDNDCDGGSAGCALEGEIDFGASPPGNVILDDASANGFVSPRVAGDVDGDGYDDFLVAGAYGDQAWVVRGPIVGPNYVSAAWAHLTMGSRDDNYATNVVGGFDWDGDGRADVAVASTQYAREDVGYLRVFTGLSGGTVRGDDSDERLDFTNAPYVGAYGLLTGDLDGDGDRGDLLARTGSVDVTGAAWLAGWLRGRSALAVNLPFDADAMDPGGVAVGDLDGDGIDDVLVGVPKATTNSAFPNAGAVYGGLGPITELGMLEAASSDIVVAGRRSSNYAGYSLALADGDGDGHLDALVGAGLNASGGDISAYLVRGPIVSGTLDSAVARVDVAAASGSASAWVGDLDGDGAWEFAVGEGGLTAWEVGLYDGNATGTLTATAGARALFTGDRYRGASIAYTGDLSGDGLPELLLGGASVRVGASTYPSVVLVDGSGR